MRITSSSRSAAGKGLRLAMVGVHFRFIMGLPLPALDYPRPRRKGQGEHGSIADAIGRQSAPSTSATGVLLRTALSRLNATSSICIRTRDGRQTFSTRKSATSPDTVMVTRPHLKNQRSRSVLTFACNAPDGPG